jgi:ubiquinone/menaquinone biosynthesis C-methylase UbiE
MALMTGIHNAAAEGYERKSDTYAAGRPNYLPAAFDDLIADLGTDAWVELGAGTGIATAPLVERGVEITAVEPVDAMRARLEAALPAVNAVAGTSEAIPVPDGSAQIVLASQSFHWFDYGPALDEISRVLVDGGALVTLWNVRNQTESWVQEYTRISDRYAGDTPRWHTMNWRRAIEADDRFVLEREASWPNPFPSSPDLVVARLLSTSFIAALDEDVQAGMADELRAAVAHLGAAFDYPYATQFEIWRRV